jgi:pyrimidine-nucleoside phosphorylase
VERIIIKKRDGGELSAREIEEAVAGYSSGRIPDYQMAALLMAIYFRGMTDDETSALTAAMVASGDTVDLSSIPGFTVDKHSTGGVGDKTTLVVAPLVAACGVPVAKLSGRGLGHTGGTLDKLEAVPGLHTDLETASFLRQVREMGLAVAGANRSLAPADGLLYALRDVTGTVESLPLIASSVMSKKIAAGAQGIVLDVKTGRGAFMREPESALALARLMVRLGRAAGRTVAALVTSMEQPLGRAVGNALELREAVETLAGGGPPDLLELCLALGTRMLRLAGVVAGDEEARRLLHDALQSGAARERLAMMVQAQGGDRAFIDDPARLPEAPRRRNVLARTSGYITAIDTLGLGLVARDLGAGRRVKTDRIDHSVGLMLHARVGDAVEAGQSLATIYAAEADAAARAVADVARLYVIGSAPVPPPPLILGQVDPAA